MKLSFKGINQYQFCWQIFTQSHDVQIMETLMDKVEKSPKILSEYRNNSLAARGICSSIILEGRGGKEGKETGTESQKDKHLGTSAVVLERVSVQ